jgi:hypothetical protein
MAWHNEFTQYFYELSEETAQEWLTILSREWGFKMLGDRELSAVVKHMADKEDFSRRPTLRDLLKGIRSHRKYQEALRKDFEAPAADCGFCNGSGLLVAAWETSEEGKVILSSVRLDSEGVLVHGNGSVPCMCSKRQDSDRSRGNDKHCHPDLLKAVHQLYRRRAGIPMARDIGPEDDL